MTPVVAIVGPTAAGKSDLAVAVAQAVGGEVLNADSMQLYVGMDIGTAKLAPSDRGNVPHHLLDIWPVSKTATLAEYQKLALHEIDAVRAREAAPILVGGSGMYVQAVVDRWQIPGTDPKLRQQLAAELAERGSAALHDQLSALDPGAAAEILPTNGRRIVRALEVIALQGSFQARLPARDDALGRVLIGLDVPRPELDERIADRVERMWAAGLVAEVEGLVALGLCEGETARRALGYSHVLRYLDGEYSQEQAKSDTVAATRRFARRQDSWFRRDPRVTWLPYDAKDLLEQATQQVRTLSA
ncbi:MAG TPA: tRNA (adenosine(37)-N6)-dimethylallyltransferase MiaA [Actinomycetes bacterium]|nr:tRNA (adenosine(37)-N6)-dimethylallyltransferase MiaA [Actinomycetes bacterium]